MVTFEDALNQHKAKLPLPKSQTSVRKTQMDKQLCSNDG